MASSSYIVTLCSNMGDVMLSFHFAQDDALNPTDSTDTLSRSTTSSMKEQGLTPLAKRKTSQWIPLLPFFTPSHNTVTTKSCITRGSICDHFVAELRDAKFSERLHLNTDLTLETPPTKVRQSEAVHQQ